MKKTLFCLILTCIFFSSCSSRFEVYREKNTVTDDFGRVVEKSKTKEKFNYTKLKIKQYEYDTVTGEMLNINFVYKIFFTGARKHDIFYYEKNKKYLNGKKIEVYIEKKKHSSVKFRHFVSIKFLPHLRKKKLIDYIYI
jgi:hypothetical protein